MELYDLFYKWVPAYVRLPILFIWFFVALTANGIFGANINDIYSSLGVYSEPYTQGYNAMYIGMGLGFILHFRLKMRFSNKTLLLAGFTAMLLMNIVCATTSSPTITIAACLVIGFGKISCFAEVYIIWVIIWSKKFDTRRMYPFLYFTALCGLYFVTWLTAQLSYVYNWQYSYIVIVSLLLLCLLLALIFAENHPLKKRLPLYQMDYTGLILLATSLLLLNYAMVNGKVEDWLESKKIVAAFTGSAVTLLLFIWRESTTRHPYFDIHLFKRGNFRLGLLYFFILGIFNIGTFQSAFSLGILHYESATNAEVGLYVIPGVLAACFFCYFWYLKELGDELLIFIGFLAFVVYHILMYNSFSNEFSMGKFWLPSTLKGFGIAVVYISVGLHLTRGIDLTKVLGAAGAMIIVRSFIGGAVSTAIFSYYSYAQKIKRFEYLAGVTDAADPAIKEHGGTLNLYRTLQEQAVLTSSKELTGYIIILGIIFLVILAIKYAYGKIMYKLATE